jgi:sacsin
MMENFDVVEPLTKRLRGLLSEYPPGTNILKELMQNADDAGATTIVNITLITTNGSPTL